MESHQHEENEKNALIGSFEAQLQQAQNQRESAIRMHQEVTDNKVKGNLHKTLATELQSSKFIEFVHLEAMNSFASDTSSCLDRCTNGRYEFRFAPSIEADLKELEGKYILNYPGQNCMFFQIFLQTLLKILFRNKVFKHAQYTTTFII